MAESYRTHFGLDDRAIQAPKGETGEANELYRSVARVLGSCTPAYLGDDALRCERYLLHAVWRWLSKVCRSPDTREAYLAAIRWWVVVSGRRSLCRQLEARPYHVGVWVDAVEAVSRSPRSVNTRASVVRSWFTWLYDQELLGRSPFRPSEHLRKVDRARVVTRPGQRRQSLTQAEAQRAVDWCLRADTPAEWGCGVALLLSGLRCIEVERAQLEDLSTKAGERTRLLARGKGKKTRVVMLEAWAVAAVRRWLAVVNAGVGRPRSVGPLMTKKRETLGYWVEQVAEHVGRPEITPHDLRRTNATLLRNSGAELEQVQEHLGHANPETTRQCYDTEQRPLKVTTGLEVPA